MKNIFIIALLLFCHLDAMDQGDSALDALAYQFNNQCNVASDPLPLSFITNLFPINSSQQDKDAGLQMVALFGSTSAVNYLISVGANPCTDEGKAAQNAMKNGHILLAHYLRNLEEHMSRPS